MLTLFPTFVEPSTNALEPFLHSLHLASSLLIIASHRPCPLPDTFQPAIRILRLRTPIAVEEAGASRLVDVLEWAEQTARLWRKNGGLRYQELMEELESFGSMRNKQVAGRLRYSVVDAPIPGSSPVTPLSSQNSLQLVSNKMSQSSSNINGLKRSSMFSTPSTDPEQRPFDAIIHFMPNKIPDKMLLKTAILVTTLTRPYVVTAAPRTPATRFWSENAKMSTSPDSKSLGGNSNNGNGNTGKRWSFLRGSRSAANSTLTVNDPTKIEKRDRLGSNTSVLSRTASTFSNTSTTRTLANYMLRARKSRIIHILPSSPSRTSNAPAYSQQAQAQAEARLIRSIEAFLLSFSFPIPTSTLSPMDPDFQRARPYLIPAGALSDVLSLSPSPSSPVEGKEAETTMFQGEWTLAELVLSGALDLPYGPEVQAANALANGGNLNMGEKGGLGEKGMSDTAKGKMKDLGFSMAYDWMAHRAWIAGVHEVVVKPGGEANLSPPARAQVRQRPALPAPSSAVVTIPAARNPSPTKAHRPPLTTSQYQQSPVKAQAQTSPAKTRPTVSTSQTTPTKSSTSPTKSPSSPVSSPTRTRAPGAQAAALSPDKRLPTPPEELLQARKAAGSTSTAPASNGNVNHGSTSAVATAYLSPNYVASKARAGNDPGGSMPRPSNSAAPVTVSPYPSRIPAHSHGQKHASSPLAVSTSTNARQADGQVRRRETMKEKEQRDRDREATFGLPTPPDSDEASAENIPIIASTSSAHKSTTSRIASSSSTNVSTVAVVGDQRRSRSAHGHEQQYSTSRPRAHTDSRPRIETVPSQTSQSSTIPPTPPAKPAPLRRDSRQQDALARPSTSSGGNSQVQPVVAPAPAQKRTVSRATDDAHKKILRRHSKHLGQLGHNRTASNSSPALVGSSLESDLSSSPELHRKRSKWKFWK